MVFYCQLQYFRIFMNRSLVFCKSKGQRPDVQIHSGQKDNQNKTARVSAARSGNESGGRHHFLRRQLRRQLTDVQPGERKEFSNGKAW